MHLTKRMGIGIGASIASLMAMSAIADTVLVTSDVTVNTTWYGTNTYRLPDPVFVRGGAKLTIQAGAIIRGEQAGSTNDAPGALVISRDGQLDALGSAFSPIVFTDLNDNHYVGKAGTPGGQQAGTAPYNQPNNLITRKWGGLIVLGQTYIVDGAPLTNSPAMNQIEGLEPHGLKSMYGGADDNHNSGTIRFVSVRYGGYVLGAANEINGMTFGAVGRGTTVHNCDVFQNKDDGFEFFGGTVDTKYMSCWSVGDDAFDIDMGYRGRGQFWLAVKGIQEDNSALDKSDTCFEWDGAVNGDSLQPSSIPTVANATFIGHGADSGQGTKDVLWHLSDGCGGRVYNSIACDFGGAVALIEGLPNNGAFDSADHVDAPYVKSGYYLHHMGGSKELEIKHNVFWKFGHGNALGVAVAGAMGANNWYQQAGKTYHGSAGPTGSANTGYDLTSVAYGNVSLNDTDDPTAPVAQLMRDPVGYGGYYPVVYLDPRVTDIRYINSRCQMPTPWDDSFFTPVNFQGAFYQDNWASWTTPARLGLLPSGSPVSSTVGAYEVVLHRSTVAITKDAGNKIDIAFNPSVHIGRMVEVWIYYHDGTRNIYYNMADGTWSNKIRPYQMIAQSFNLSDIIDATTVSGKVLNVIVDSQPNGILSVVKLNQETLTM